MPDLQLLGADHASAVRAFELANRAYFARSVSDRGDEFFDQFSSRYNALLTEEKVGLGAFYVLVAGDGSILGRFNLYAIEDGMADVGYRVAEQVAGSGVATANLQRLCRLAANRHGLHTLNAATSHRNLASQRVLVKCRFVPVGPADPASLGGKSGMQYQCDLASE